MSESIAEILTIGGHKNTLGRAEEVTEMVLNQPSRLAELYDCLFLDDAWVRMRASDALEKVCRVHPEWFSSYIDKLLTDVASSDQPSIQWHLAQILTRVSLSPEQKAKAIHWLKDRLSSIEVDWIVAVESMKALDYFINQGDFNSDDFHPLLAIQRGHHSKTVIKKAIQFQDKYA